MTIGIYCLQFEGTDKVYIGKSKHIEKRFKEHLRILKNTAGAIKLQNAYNKYGEPILIILCECSLEDLDQLEVEAIEIYNSYLNGYNSTIGGDSGGYGLSGPDNGNAKYSREQIVDCFNLLANTDLLFKDISDKTGVSTSTISFIASGTKHTWLLGEFPSEYTIMRTKCGTRNSRTHSAGALGITYPEIISPKGISYNISNVNSFAKEHNIDVSNLHKVLKGKASTVKGWKLK